MVLIVIAAIALYRRIRTLIQQRAASRLQRGHAELPPIPHPLQATPHASSDASSERLVLQEIHAGLVSTSELVPAAQLM